MYLNKYYNLAKNILFPICRSITGNGIKKTLKIIKSQLPKLKIYQAKSGTKVFDWRVPPEWNIKDAYILDKNNIKIIDFKKNNLHLVSYSVPISKILKKNELLKRLHDYKKIPEAIPYVTSYYKKYWGFCCSYNKKKQIIDSYSRDDKFKVVINSSLKKNGKLSYGQFLIPGKSKQEILISTYICHPSMANNELSGPTVAMALIKSFLKKKIIKHLGFYLFLKLLDLLSLFTKILNILKKM